MMKYLIIPIIMIGWMEPTAARASEAELTELLDAHKVGYSMIAGATGNWLISVHTWDPEAHNWSVEPDPSKQGRLSITPLEHDRGLLLSFKTNFSNAQGYLSYDPWRTTYRMATIDDAIGLVDVQEGAFSDDQLMLDNVASNTTFTYEREHYYTQTIFTFKDGRLIRLTIFNKKSGGSDWIPNARFELTNVRKNTGDKR